jgi:hypothetical protein
MSAWEGVPGCACAGVFHDLKRGVEHPRAGDTERHFQNLDCDQTEEPAEQQVVSSLFIDAPQHDECRDDKDHFAACVGKRAEHGVQNGVSPCGDPSEKIHVASFKS